MLTHTLTHTHGHTRTHPCSHNHSHTHSHMLTHTHTLTHTLTLSHTHSHAHTHTQTHTVSLSLYLFGLVIIDNVDPHSSRMGMRWCHGLLLWNLETPAGHEPSHRLHLRSLRPLMPTCGGHSGLVSGRRPHRVPQTQSRRVTGGRVIPETTRRCLHRAR